MQRHSQDLKAKYLEKKSYPLWLGNISKDFILDNMKKTLLKATAKVFSVDYDPTQAIL